MKKKILNVYFRNRNEKRFQVDLNSDLKEESDLKSRCWFTLFELVIPGSWIGMNLLPEYGQISLDMCNFLNIPEYAWKITCLNKPEF